MCVEALEASVRDAGSIPAASTILSKHFPDTLCSFLDTNCTQTDTYNMSRSGKNHNPDTFGTDLDASGDNLEPNINPMKPNINPMETQSPELKKVVEAWQNLPDHIKSTILTLIKSASVE